MSAAQEMSRAKLALRMMKVSGRRMLARRGGWAVVAGKAARMQTYAVLSREEGERLIADGAVQAAAGGGYVLTGAEVRAVESESARVRASPAAFFVAARGGAVRRRASGAGFLALANRAREGDGPLSLRQVEAGLRLIADAEQAGRDPKLSMRWDGVVRDGGGGASGGGLSPVARGAERRLRRVRTEAGERAFMLAWAACVEARPMVVLAVRAGVGAKRAAGMLAAALEKIAKGYDG